MKIKEDLHVHTYLSACARNDAHAIDYVRMAEELGLTTIAFTDHLWDSAIPGASDWYKPQDMAHIEQLRAELAELPPSGVRVLFGAETECAADGTVAISEEAAARLDVLLVPNSHTHMLDFIMPREFDNVPDKHGAFLLRRFHSIVNSPVARYITAVPHPFYACGKSEEYKEKVLATITDAQFAECFAAARERNIALEFNTATLICVRRDRGLGDEFIRMYTLAREAGCRFTVGSDAHAPAHMVSLKAALPFLEAAGITEDMLLRP